ncbi:hypothetical protein MJC1_03584 [Methylocystis sp. MJC1]|uniref:DsbA family protein n=1 Tax=Methylocystis sp. MJC1 TaxID=2654282 RepID=UPI0013EAE441|nr:DsbA family protein [Methylocystis sp. MJC1]KAF2989266.1 hypothetical protein MJC1_03584 [Methylocystis sp. MJC1]
MRDNAKQGMRSANDRGVAPMDVEAVGRGDAVIVGQASRGFWSCGRNRTALALLGALFSTFYCVGAFQAAAGEPLGDKTTEPPRVARWSSREKAEMGAFIREYLLVNPEILAEAQNVLEARERVLRASALRDSVKANATELFHDIDAAVIGNRHGSVTIVEFTDYNCPYCRRAASNLDVLVTSDPTVRVVVKPLPILSKGSEEAARIALAAKRQGKFAEAHKILSGLQGVVNAENAMHAVASLGLDMNAVKRDAASESVTAEITAARTLAEILAIHGTPFFVVGETIIEGAPAKLLEMLKTQVADAKRTGR